MTAIATNTGVVDTEAVLADEKVVDMVNEFQLLDPNQTQFMTMLQDSRLKSAPATREKINWLEDQYFPRQSSTSASGTSATTTVNVATGEGAYFRANDLVRDGATGEMFSVTSVATDALTVVRAIGNVAAAAFGSGDKLMIVGNAAAQNADVGALKATKRVLGYNYTQRQRNPYGFSGTDEAINTYGGGQVDGETAKKAVEHKRAIESTLWFGARSFTSASPNSQSTCGGIIEYLSTNVFPSIGALDKTVWETDIAACLQHGDPNQKVLFVAPKVAQALSGFLRDNWVRATPSDTVYGVKVNSYISGSYGTSIPVVVKQEWGPFGTASYGGVAFLVDMSLIRYRPMTNRDTALLRNRQSPGVDGVINEYRTEFSLMVAQEKAHGYFSGITG